MDWHIAVILADAGIQLILKCCAKLFRERRLLDSGFRRSDEHGLNCSQSPTMTLAWGEKALMGIAATDLSST